MKKAVLIALITLAAAGLACAGPGRGSSLGNGNLPDPTRSAAENESSPAGDPAQGERLFTGQVDGQYPCSVCHSLQPNQTVIGPSLAGIATTAAARIEGYSAEQYLHESIVTPGAYVVEGFTPGIMPEFGAQMTEQQLADLIAFLMAQD